MEPFVARVSHLFSATVTLLHEVYPATSCYELLLQPMREVQHDRKSFARAKFDSYLRMFILQPVGRRRGLIASSGDRNGRMMAGTPFT
jgi:hypothetical protein